MIHANEFALLLASSTACCAALFVFLFIWGRVSFNSKHNNSGKIHHIAPIIYIYTLCALFTGYVSTKLGAKFVTSDDYVNFSTNALMLASMPISIPIIMKYLIVSGMENKDKLTITKFHIKSSLLFLASFFIASVMINPIINIGVAYKITQIIVYAPVVAAVVFYFIFLFAGRSG